MLHTTIARKTVGFALCGSYCTFEAVLAALGKTAELFDVVPIMSHNAAFTDTRFGTAESFRRRIEDICKRKVITTLVEAEPFGPKKLLDILVIAPATGNTIGKMTGGISDTAVTLAYKAHLRNARPIVIAVSTNDALSGNAANIGLLLNRRNHFFVPFGQDDAVGKPTSLVADFTQIPATVTAALDGMQIQPMLVT
jgi:dipicolinate synthase subunit B